MRPSTQQCLFQRCDCPRGILEKLREGGHNVVVDAEKAFSLNNASITVSLSSPPPSPPPPPSPSLRPVERLERSCNRSSSAPHSTSSAARSLRGLSGVPRSKLPHVGDKITTRSIMLLSIMPHSHPHAHTLYLFCGATRHPPCLGGTRTAPATTLGHRLTIIAGDLYILFVRGTLPFRTPSPPQQAAPFRRSFLSRTPDT